MKKIDEDKQKILQKKKDLQAKEKLIKEKEKQSRAKKFKEIGSLTFKANIDTIDTNILLGAFLELSEKLKEDAYAEQCKFRANNFLKKEEKNDLLPISISFKEEISKEVKDSLKETGFRWNKFRKEFHGYGLKDEIEQILSGKECVIEVLSC